MIRRYLPKGQALFRKTLFSSNILTGSTTRTQTYNTAITGEPGSVVTFGVTTYTHSNGGASFTVDGVSHVLSDTFTRTLDSGGNASFVQVIDIGTTTPGNAINVILTITNTTIGPIGIPATNNISKTI
jgi:hypothetical protein